MLYIIMLHIDDQRSCHQNPSGNDNFEMFLDKMYGAHSKLSSHHVKVNDYSRTRLDNRVRGEFIFAMTAFLNNM